MNTPKDKEKIAEWHLFKRLADLEDITLELMEKADTTEPTLKNTSITARDARILALEALVCGFGAYIIDSSNPRAIADIVIATLKSLGLSPKTQEVTEELLIKACQIVKESKARECL